MSGNNGSAGGSTMPKLTNSIHEANPPFLSKTFEMVNDPKTDSIISWSSSATSLFLHDTDKLKDLLPKYFNHDNVSKFTKRLLEYGFTCRDKFLQEYAHEGFQKGKKHMIKNIKSQKQNCAMKKNMHNDMENTLERLRFYQTTSMEDVSRFQQQQQTVKKYLASAKGRLQSTICKFAQKTVEIEDGNAGVSTQSSLSFGGQSRIDQERSEFAPQRAKKLLMHKRSETRPWLDPTKFGARAEFEKGKNDLKQLEGEILNLEISQGFTENQLTAIEQLLQNTRQEQQEIEMSMDEIFRNLDSYRKGNKKRRLKKEAGSGKETKNGSKKSSEPAMNRSLVQKDLTIGSDIYESNGFFHEPKANEMSSPYNQDTADTAVWVGILENELNSS